MEQVNWDDVQHFIKALNREVSGLNAGLPTEAQWENACRAGTTTAYSFGDTIMTDQANYNSKLLYAGGRIGGHHLHPMAVKSLLANPWGLYQMHGNVQEWCQDRLGEGYPKTLVVDPVGPSTVEIRVVRGGSWRCSGAHLRSAYRSSVMRSFRNDDLGFRLTVGCKNTAER